MNIMRPRPDTHRIDPPRSDTPRGDAHLEAQRVDAERANVQAHHSNVEAQRASDQAQRASAEVASLRSAGFRPRRRHWPGVLAAAVIGAGIAAAMVSSYYDDRSIGQRIDATVGAAEQKVQAQVNDIKAGASAVADQGVATSERLAVSLNDAGITAAVKTALAADPSLSALKIDVATRDGVVTLAGPAPNEKARERAAVLAAAPEGVRSVDNRLVVAMPSATRS